jgi:GT2 family glycosyltransferase
MPVHDRDHLLDRVLDRLAANTTYENVELIAVDDHSTDRSLEILREFERSGRFPSVTVVESPGRGAITALNTALGTASGEVCVQLDDDVTVETRGWVERMLDLMLLDEAVGVVTAKIVFDSGELHACGVNVVGRSGWHERTTEPFEPIGERQWLSRTKQRVREGEGGAVETRAAEVDSGIGCCMMYRRDDALDVGGYDQEWSPVWFDDVDLCIKLRARGRKVFYIPDVRAVHHVTGRAERPTGIRRFTPSHVRKALLRRAYWRLPYSATRAIESRFDVDMLGHYTREQCARLRHHHALWREKWGWDARNPDPDEVRRRWGHTEICWATDPERRAAGERIAAAYEARRDEAAAPAGQP